VSSALALIENVCAIDCFATNFKILLGEIGTNGFSKKAAIVRDQYTVRHIIAADVRSARSLEVTLCPQSKGKRNEYSDYLIRPSEDSI
jgi:hypothetical protein